VTAACTCAGAARDAHNLDCPVRISNPREGDDDARAFCYWFRERVEALGLSDMDLAILIDVSLPSVRRWRSGRSAPMSAIRNLARKKLGEAGS
jgi:hypothetical protein